jgi:hypothetical protein
MNDAVEVRPNPFPHPHLDPNMPRRLELLTKLPCILVNHLPPINALIRPQNRSLPKPEILNALAQISNLPILAPLRRALE